MTVNEENARLAAEHFDIGFTDYSIARYGCGHINDTFLLEKPGRKPRFIVQRVNGSVFKHPDEVMANIAAVTTFLRGKVAEAGGDPLREVLTLVPTLTDETFWRDGEGGVWRVYLFVEGTVTYQLPDTPELFAESSRAFGGFAALLRDYPADTLFETIPRFHDTPDRCRQFHRALSADPLGLAKTCAPEIDFVLAREHEAGTLIDLQRAGRLPTRVTHNDTKLNNVLLDAVTGRTVCVIDLDTVMPGLALYDYGDSIRFGASTAAEDERDLSLVGLDPAMFEAYTRGYLEATDGALTDEETALLPMGAKLMTYECGVRFLTDYLSGDVYFKISRPAQNLDRARTQFALVDDMERRWSALLKTVNDCAAIKA